MKAVFSRHGIPELLISDNGPQYQSHEMKQFSQAYGFVHVTSTVLIIPKAMERQNVQFKQLNDFLDDPKIPF